MTLCGKRLFTPACKVRPRIGAEERGLKTERFGFFAGPLFFLSTFSLFWRRFFVMWWRGVFRGVFAEIGVLVW